jgi:hypothetical protein
VVGRLPESEEGSFFEAVEMPSERRERSQYPVLPAPEPGVEPIDDADAALRRIRERLVDGDASPAGPRRFRADG